MADVTHVHVTVDDKPASAEVSKKVHERIKQTLEEELAKEKTHGAEARKISGHLKW
jgi:hypothetical protein